MGTHLKCIVGITALAIAFYGFWRMRRDYLLFTNNSDLLYLEALFRDLVSHRYRLTGWQLTPAPYFFPDMPLFFLSAALAPNPPDAYCLYSGILLAGILGTLFWMIKPINRSRADRLLIVGLLALLMLTLSLPQRQYWFVVRWLLAPCGHGGGLLSGLVLIGLAMRIVERSTAPRIALFLIISVLAVLSDRLTLSAFLAPIVITTLIALALRRNRERLLACVAVTASTIIANQITAWFIQWNWRQDRFHVPLVTSRYRGSALLQIHFEQFRQDWLHYAGPRTALSIVALVSLAAIIAAIVHLRKSTGRGTAQRVEFLWLCAILSVVAWIAAFSAPVIIAIWENGDSFRYALSFLILPLFLLGLAGSYALGRMTPARGASIGFGALIAALPLTLPMWRLPGADSSSIFYNGLTATIDRVTSQHGLHAGYSDYWSSRPVSMFSKTGALLSPVRIDGDVLDSDPRISNPNHWCQVPFGSIGDYPIYDFVVCPLVDEPTVRKRFGNPARVLEQGSLKILVYDRPTDVLFRCLGRARIVSAAAAPLPWPVVSLPILNRFKAPGHTWNDRNTRVIRPDEQLSVRLKKPATADVLAITVNASVPYHLQFKLGDAVAGTYELSPLPGTGLQPLDIRLAPITGGKPFDTIVIGATAASGNYSVGSVMVFPDPVLHPRATRD